KGDDRCPDPYQKDECNHLAEAIETHRNPNGASNDKSGENGLNAIAGNLTKRNNDRRRGLLKIQHEMQVGWNNREHIHPPVAWLREKQSRQKDSRGRPDDGNAGRRELEQEADDATSIVASRKQDHVPQTVRRLKRARLLRQFNLR